MGSQIALEHRLRLIPDGLVLFPVKVHVWASAVRKVKGIKKEVELRRRFYYEVVDVGSINVEKLKMSEETEVFDVTAHPDEEFTIIGEHVMMKLPNVIPQDYAMCEVGISVQRIGRVSRIKEDAEDLLNVIGPTVQNHLDTIARLCGGQPPFTPEEEAAAQVKADGEKKE